MLVSELDLEIARISVKLWHHLYEKSFDSYKRHLSNWCIAQEKLEKLEEIFYTQEKEKE